MHHFGPARERPRAEAGGLIAHPVQYIAGRVDHATGGGVGHRLQHDQVSKAFKQIGGEPARVVARVDDRLNRTEQRCGVSGGQGIDGIVDECDVGGTQQCQRPWIADPIAIRTGQQLVEHRQGVTGRAPAGPDHQRIHRLVDGHVLLLADPFQQCAHGARSQQPERVVVGARTDRRQHLLRFRGREDEDQVFGRLLDDLQQRVERLGSDHVRFVDDEDAVSRLTGNVKRAVPKLARIIHAVMAGRVKLGDVEAAGPVRRQRDTGPAHPTRGWRRALLAVQRAGQDPRRRRLTAAPRTGEQIRVVDAPGRQSGGQRLGDVLLPDHVGEGCRSVLAVERHAQQATDADRRSATMVTRL